MKFAIVAVFLAVVVLATTADYAEDRPHCFCTRELSPVCATNGITYPNRCEFKCAKSQLAGRAADELRVARGGACDGPEVPEFARDLK